MSEKDSLYIEEVDALDTPDDSDRPVGEAPGAAYVPLSIPPSIYKTYAGRKFRLLREAKERIRGVLLEMDTWNVLWQVDGQRTVEQIAENLVLPLDVTIYHVESLKLMGIICPVDAVYLPEFILEKTDKQKQDRKRRKTDADSRKR